MGGKPARAVRRGDAPSSGAGLSTPAGLESVSWRWRSAVGTGAGSADPGLFDELVDAVIITNPAGVVMGWNRAAEKLYGWTAEEAIGTNVLELTVASGAGVPAEQILEALASGEAWSGDYLVRNKSGALFIASVSDTPLRDEDGNVVAIVGVSRSATAKHDRSASVRQSAAAMVALDDAPDAIHILQGALVRPDFPEVPGLRFSAAHIEAENSPGLSGDWYDAFTIPDGRVMVVVGDVTGHGLAATRFMGKTRHAIRAYGSLEMPLEDLLAALDRFVAHFSRDGLLVTAQLALLDPDHAVMTLASAGHPPPIVVEASGSRIAGVRNGRVLGVHGATAARYRVTQLPFRPGSALVMYTDGLIERRTELIDQGIERLALALNGVSTAHLAAIQDAAISACLDGIQRHDDACIIIVANDGPVS